MLQIDNVNVEKVTKFNFLGLIINEQLNWKDHTNMLLNRCSHTIGVLNKHDLLISIKIMLYNSVIFSHLKYCICVYGFQCGRGQELYKNLKNK